jgi:hypothetical protein
MAIIGNIPYFQTKPFKKSIRIIPSNPTQPCNPRNQRPPDVNFHQELADGGPSVHGLGAEILVSFWISSTFWAGGHLEKSKIGKKTHKVLWITNIYGLL